MVSLETVTSHNEALFIWALAGWGASNLAACLILANFLPTHIKEAFLLTHIATAQSSQLTLPSPFQERDLLGNRTSQDKKLS